jgi:hypothetical protein
MEIIVRMRRYMEELENKYKVAYIPDPLWDWSSWQLQNIYIPEKPMDSRYYRNTTQT